MKIEGEGKGKQAQTFLDDRDGFSGDFQDGTPPRQGITRITPPDSKATDDDLFVNEVPVSEDTMTGKRPRIPKTI